MIDFYSIQNIIHTNQHYLHHLNHYDDRELHRLMKIVPLLVSKERKIFQVTERSRYNSVYAY